MFLVSSLDVAAGTVSILLDTARDVFAGAVVSGLVLSRDSLFSKLSLVLFLSAEISKA